MSVWRVKNFFNYLLVRCCIHSSTVRYFVLSEQLAGRHEERHPATLRGEPPSRVKVLERMRVGCLDKPRSADYSSGPKESLKTRVEDLRIARHPADSQLATK